MMLLVYLTRPFLASKVRGSRDCRRGMSVVQRSDQVRRQGVEWVFEEGEVLA